MNRIHTLFLIVGIAAGATAFARQVNDETTKSSDCAACDMSMTAEQDCPDSACTACDALLKQYLPIAEALATDNLAGTKSGAGLVAKSADDVGMKQLGEAATALAKTDSLSAARESFKKLSAMAEPLTKGAKGYVVMHCPMAGADWIQKDTNVRNPYYGQAMLTCGMAKKT